MMASRPCWHQIIYDYASLTVAKEVPKIAGAIVRIGDTKTWGVLERVQKITITTMEGCEKEAGGVMVELLDGDIPLGSRVFLPPFI